MVSATSCTQSSPRQRLFRCAKTEFQIFIMFAESLTLQSEEKLNVDAHDAETKHKAAVRFQAMVEWRFCCQCAETTQISSDPSCIKCYCGLAMPPREKPGPIERAGAIHNVID
jgi:hypothetical protein